MADLLITTQDELPGPDGEAPYLLFVDETNYGNTRFLRTNVLSAWPVFRGNAVFLSEEDWRAIQETLHLVSIPGMRETILEGMATEASELSPEPGW